MRIHGRGYGLLHVEIPETTGGSSSLTSTPPDDPATAIANSIVFLLAPNQANPTATQIAAAIDALSLPLIPGLGLTPAQLQTAANSVLTGVPPSQQAYANAIAASVAQSVAANVLANHAAGGTAGTPANLQAAQAGVAQGQSNTQADVAADTGTPWYQSSGADLTPVGCNANGDAVNAEGLALTGAGITCAQWQAQQAVAAATAEQQGQQQAAIQAQVGSIAYAQPPPDLSWLWWSGGGVVLLGAAWWWHNRRVSA